MEAEAKFWRYFDKSHTGLRSNFGCNSVLLSKHFVDGCDYFRQWDPRICSQVVAINDVMSSVTIVNYDVNPVERKTKFLRKDLD